MDKVCWGMLGLIVLFGLILFVGLAKETQGFGETGGPWTASEKRQVISLLEEIRDNTR